MITPESIERLKNQLDIVDVIGTYLELKKNGANFKAPCPFHNEKTASFVVSPQKQIFHCFGCGVGGDAIKFVMDYEKLSYPEAVEKLASSFNFSLRYTQGDDSYSGIKRILESIQIWYVKTLEHTLKAKEYLTDKIGSAKWLIKAIDQRRKTMIRTMECIVEAQKEFFDKTEYRSTIDRY